MKTPDEIKDEVAKSHGYDSWDDLLDCVPFAIGIKAFCDLENEAMEAYAQQFREGDKKGVSEQLPPNNITDKEYKDLMKALYPKDNSKHFRM